MAALIRVGWPVGFILLFEVGLFTTGTFMMGWVGTTAPLPAPWPVSHSRHLHGTAGHWTGGLGTGRHRGRCDQLASGVGLECLGLGAAAWPLRPCFT